MSLKDRASKRELPSMPFSVQDKDPTEAQEALAKALGLLRQAEIKGDEKQISRCKAGVTRAKKKLEACHVSFTIQALEADDYDDVIDEHPPTPEQLAEASNDPVERPEWNDETFYPALLTRCVNDDSMDEADWAAFMKRLSRGERRQLKYALIAINENERMPEAMLLPKGSLGTGTSNWR